MNSGIQDGAARRLGTASDRGIATRVPRRVSVWGTKGTGRLAAAFGAILAVAGCGAKAATAIDGEPLAKGTAASIHIEALGGIAALREVAAIDSASGQVSWSTGPLCVPGAACPPTDSAGGTLAAAEVSAFFERAAAPAFKALAPDYGHSTQCADQRDYIVTVRANGRERVLRGDDCTLPALLAEFTNDVRLAVMTAAGR